MDCAVNIWDVVEVFGGVGRSPLAKFVVIGHSTYQTIIRGACLTKICSGFLVWDL